MKMSKFLTAIALILVLIVGLTACQIPDVDVITTESTTTTPTTPTTTPNQGGDPTPDHECESVCPTCGLCLNAECAEAVCSDKCEGHQSTPTESTPVITVNPDHIEMHAGDDIELMFGVTATDELDEEVRLIIDDDDGFDADVEGTYTITYLAQNKFGKTATATRTIVVKKALSALSLEVQKNLLGESKWQGTIISFKNQLFVKLNASATLDKQSGVFYNASSSEITVTVSNSDYAVVAIITANGVVIEGRDGANGNLVNAANPVRTSSTSKMTKEQLGHVADDMVIPAGGYAIVIQNGYAGSGVDYDGRGFMNYNVIGTYGNVVRLVWADTSEVLTPYVDQAPVISGNDTEIVAGNGFELSTGILAGVTAKDDNGTFDPNDDVKVEITIADEGGFDIAVEGTYTITLSATDGTHTTTATRKVKVTTSAVEITVNGNVHTTVDNLIAVDKDLTVLGKYTFILYTPNYKGGLNWSNGWGEAFIINQYGEVVRIYDGANGKYYDAENAAGVEDASKCTAAGYLTEAFNSRQEGEYLLVAPNGNGNVTRAFLLANRTIGAKVVLPGVTFAHKCESVCVQCGLCLDAECTEAACSAKCEGHVHNCEALCDLCLKCTSDCDNEVCAAKCDCVTVVVNGKSLKILGGTIAIDVAAPSLGNYNFVVYTYNFKKDNATLSYNNGWSQAFILNQYGQVVRIYDGVSGGKYFDAANRSGVAGVTAAGDTLKDAYASLSEGETLILGANGGMNGNAGRGFLGGVRVIGALATIPGVTFETLPEHTCESKCADCGKCMDVTCIMPACLEQCTCHRCESICAKCNGCLDPACTEKACATKCSCHDCESLCAICGGCKDTACTNEVCAKKCVCSDTSANKYFAINGTSFKAAEGKWMYNTQCGNATEPKAQNYKMIIFDKFYTGTFETNAYGVALVVDAEGKLVKAYDWGAYYDLNGKGTMPHTANNYATYAFSQLKNGETLIIFPNDGVNAADSARTFAKNISDNWENYKGKQVVLTGYTFGQIPPHSCEHVCPQCGLCLDTACAEEVCASKCKGHAHVCESTCATCSGCKDAACTEDACKTKCGCKVLTFDDKTFTAVKGKWAYNTANVSGMELGIFDKSFTGKITAQSYGAAIVVDQYGTLVKIYDGANGGFYTVDGKAASTHFTTSNYATTAFSELQEGEILLVFNQGSRNFALGLRGVNGGRAYCGVKGTLTGFEFK